MNRFLLLLQIHTNQISTILNSTRFTMRNWSFHLLIKYFA